MDREKEIAVVLVSGGMDSALTAGYAHREYELAFLHVNYGQRTEDRELKAFNDTAEYYGTDRRLVVDISHLKDIGGSSLTDEKMEVTQADLDSKEIPTSYVPFRNANILSIAVSWAEVLGATKIYIGAVEEDSSGYPDCRKEFFDAFNLMMEKGTKPHTRIEIVTPIIDLTKKDIVLKSVEMGSPLHLTWSCYKNNDEACGECDSCALRLRGFKLAGVEDPIKYKVLA